MKEKFEVKDGNVGFCRLSIGEVHKTIEPHENILIDLDANGAPLAIEVMDFSDVDESTLVSVVAPIIVRHHIVVTSGATQSMPVSSSIEAPSSIKHIHRLTSMPAGANCGA